jgi:hypothetical protein
MFPYGLNRPFPAEAELRQQPPLGEEPNGRMTLLEARWVGAAAGRLHKLRNLYGRVTAGSLNVNDGTYSGVSEALSKVDAQALILTLIDRETAYLTGVGVEVDQWSPE